MIGNMMRVTLVASTEVHHPIPDYIEHGWGTYPYPTHADDLAEQAGRLCYLSWHRPNPATRQNGDYLANILLQGHFSVLEHASATFYIEGVSRNLTHELIRHRHLSFSEVSQRYVDVSAFPFVGHPALNGAIDGDGPAVGAARALYRALVQGMTAEGLDRKTARGAARSLLPGGLETRILVTGNMRAWRDMLAKRLHPAADAEIRKLAGLILAELRAIAPATFQDFPGEAE